MTRKPTTIDEFFEALTPDQRVALTKLRKIIHSAVPSAEECISYGIPAVRLGGRFFVGFGASKHHCAFYPGASPMAACKADLKGYDTSKGTIRFPADSPLPASLVRKLLKVRVQEYTRSKRTKRRTTSTR